MKPWRQTGEVGPSDIEANLGYVGPLLRTFSILQSLEVRSKQRTARRQQAHGQGVQQCLARQRLSRSIRHQFRSYSRPFRFRLSAFRHATSSLFWSWVPASTQDLGPVPSTQVRGCGVSGFQRLALETTDSFRAQARRRGMRLPPTSAYYCTLGFWISTVGGDLSPSRTCCGCRSLSGRQTIAVALRAR